MTMRPGLRKAALTAHVTTSVGWLGAVAAFLALALVGLAGEDPQTVRGAYIAAMVVTWFVIVPLCLAALVTGVTSALGTPWGLFRHYWVVFKLLINVFATIILLMYMQTLGSLADMAAATSGAHLGGLRSPSPLLHAAVALVLLVAATTLAVYKPPGMTRYGRRRAREAPNDS